MNHSAVTVANTATLILSSNRSKAGFLIKNIGTATIFLGGATVTTANGFPLGQEEIISSDGGTEYEGDLYGIVASGTQEARILEWGENEI